MNGYTVEVRTAILNGDHNIHTWLQMNHPDGTKEAWGFYPATDSAGNMIYGPGDVRSEDTAGKYTASSGPLPVSEEQYQAMSKNIAAMDANPPTYSIVSLPGGIQCSMWAINTLQEAGVVPVAISPKITPELIPFWDSLMTS